MKTLVAGTFDNFHIGHQWLIWSAYHRSDKLVVIVARDKTVEQIKAQTPKNFERARMARVLMEFVSYPNTKVRLGRQDRDFWMTIEEEQPNLILLGYDQGFDEALCRKKFPNINIERCSAYGPDVFKSSKF